MDTVTHFSLGACVGAAVAGRRVGVRRAAIASGVLAILPDIDLFWPYASALDRLVLHRGLTHSLVVQAAAAPLIAEGLGRLAGVIKGSRAQIYLAVFLALASHALLDSITIYGTRLFWPVWSDAVGLGSVFIIDPLYTLPLLFATVWAMCLRHWNRAFGRVIVAAFALSTAYLGWGAAAQQIAQGRAERLLAGAGISPDRVVATPTPFNSVFWRVIAIHGSEYFNVYVPLLGGESAITAYVHPRRPASVECLERNGSVEKLITFTDGFYRFEADNGVLVIADLRMGLAPHYVFRFVVAEHARAGFTETAPRRLRSGRVSPGDVRWLKAGILGRRVVRPAEADRIVDLKSGRPARSDGAHETAC